MTLAIQRDDATRDTWRIARIFRRDNDTSPCVLDYHCFVRVIETSARIDPASASIRPRISRFALVFAPRV